MTRRYRIAIVICAFVGATVCVPSLAFACDWPSRTPAQLFDDATDVFVGKVVEGQYVRDEAGKVTFEQSKASGTLRGSLRGSARFAVVTRYKGAPASEMTVMASGSNCDFTFVVGDTYLVFGVVKDGRFQTGSPWMPVRVTPPEPSSLSVGDVLKYLESRKNTDTPPQPVRE